MILYLCGESETFSFMEPQVTIYLNDYASGVQ